MSIEIRESLPLSRFIYDYKWTPVKGTYLNPLRYFANERSQDPNDYLEVIKVIDVDGTDLALTRGGGIFARDHGNMKTPKEVDELATTVNLLMCDFALQGLASHPATDTDLHDAKLIGKHASIVGGFGIYAEKTWGPFFLLASKVGVLAASNSSHKSHYWPVNAYWHTCNPEILGRIGELHGALKLKSVAPTLPSLVVAAIHHSSRHNVSETILTAWIVCEQILSFVSRRGIRPP